MGAACCQLKVLGFIAKSVRTLTSAKLASTKDSPTTMRLSVWMTTVRVPCTLDRLAPERERLSMLLLLLLALIYIAYCLVIVLL